MYYVQLVRDTKYNLNDPDVASLCRIPRYSHCRSSLMRVSLKKMDHFHTGPRKSNSFISCREADILQWVLHW